MAHANADTVCRGFFLSMFFAASLMGVKEANALTLSETLIALPSLKLMAGAVVAGTTLSTIGVVMDNNVATKGGLVVAVGENAMFP